MQRALFGLTATGCWPCHAGTGRHDAGDHRDPDALAGGLMSETYIETTRAIVVSVRPVYLEDQSTPEDDRHV